MFKVCFMNVTFLFKARFCATAYLFRSSRFGQNTYIRVLDTWAEICIFASGFKDVPYRVPLDAN